MIVSHLAAAGALAFATLPARASAQEPAHVLPPPRTAADMEFRAFLVEFEVGANRFLNGDATLWIANAWHTEDASLFNPFGADLQGWDEVGPMYARAASQFAPSGASMAVEYLAIEVGGDLAYTVAIERSVVRRISQAESDSG